MPSEIAGGVALQVNLAPSDLAHVRTILPHQLRRWGGQVDEVVWTLDTRRSPGPRGEGFDAALPAIRRALESLAQRDGRPRIHEVDYGPEATAALGERFFGGEEPPAKDCFGAPFMPYFSGLHAARSRYVLHMDGDMLFGGGSQAWVAEAVALLEDRDEILAVAPLAGPPTRSGRLPRRVVRRDAHTQLFGSRAARESRSPRTYRFRHMSTRLFLVDLRRLEDVAAPLALLPAPAWSYGAAVEEYPYLPAETSLSAAMRREGLVRLDHQGRPPGMWALHPGNRTPEVMQQLRVIVSAVEEGDVPPEQAGDYELLVPGVPRPKEGRRPRAIRLAWRATGLPRVRGWARRRRLERRFAAL